MTSRLKSNDQWGRVAILAGSGLLPELLAIEVKKPFIISLSSNNGEWIKAFEHYNIEITRPGKILKALRIARVDTLVLAGGIKVRPSFWSFKPDWATIKLLQKLFRALRKGDDGLLRSAISWLESEGFMVIGAHELLPELLTPYSCLTQTHPSQQDEVSIAYGIQAAVELGQLDIGQATVAKADQIYASEDNKGTAAMLAKLGAITELTKRADGGVLVKFAKPGQELRVDLPSIGPDTIHQARLAGLSGIALEASKSLILDKQEVIRIANGYGMFVLGRRRDSA